MSFPQRNSSQSNGSRAQPFHSRQPGRGGGGRVRPNSQFRGGSSRQQRGDRHSKLSTRSNGGVTDQIGDFDCDYIDASTSTLVGPSSLSTSSLAEPSLASTSPSQPFKCSFTCHSALALILHKADRHLIYPEGGIEELKKRDPMLVAEEREKRRRNKNRDRPLPNEPMAALADDGIQESHQTSTTHHQTVDDEKILDGPADATIVGLNIQLNTPELIQEWINQRRKRWPTHKVIEQKEKEKQERRQRSEMIYGQRIGGQKRQMDSSFPSQGAASSSTPQGAATCMVQKRPKWESQSTFTPTILPEQCDSDSDGPPSEAGIGSVSETKNADSSKAGLADSEAVDSNPPESEEGDQEREREKEEDQVMNDSDDDDDDDAPEVQSSKLTEQPTEPEASPNDHRPICKHFLQDRCSFGDRCRKRHTLDQRAPTNDSLPVQGMSNNNTKKRVHPRAPPPNPFSQPDLLRQLLRNEIGKHVDSVAQAIRFIVDNDMLLHVETEIGQAEEQQRKRGLVQEVSFQQQQPKDACRIIDSLQEPKIQQPLLDGALAIVDHHDNGNDGDENKEEKEEEVESHSRPRKALYMPTSPLLRPLSSLTYPPEPDPLVYLDPLRRDDPKPLLLSQLVAIAKDPIIRSILTPSSCFYPHGNKSPGLERAIISLDALPSDNYRNAALEMILGICQSSSSSLNSSSSGLFSLSKDGKKKITETDLFRLGLRVGNEQVIALRNLADRLTYLLDSSLQLSQVNQQHWNLLEYQERDEMRKLYWEKEADRLDRLRKLGIDV